MRGTVLYAPRDVRFEERAAPTIPKPTDAVIKISATCVCGSDLWNYRGINPASLGHYVGRVGLAGELLPRLVAAHGDDPLRPPRLGGRGGSTPARCST